MNNWMRKLLRDRSTPETEVQKIRKRLDQPKRAVVAGLWALLFPVCLVFLQQLIEERGEHIGFSGIQ